LGGLATGDPRNLTGSGNRKRGQRVSFIRDGRLRFEFKEDAMTDPRFTDPRYSDPQLSDPVIRRDETAGGMWGWIAGVAVLILIGFLIVAGWNNNGTTANNGSSPPAASTASRPTAPSTTGSGASSPQPFTPAPSSPAPSAAPAAPKTDSQ